MFNDSIHFHDLVYSCLSKLLPAHASPMRTPAEQFLPLGAIGAPTVVSLAVQAIINLYNKHC